MDDKINKSDIADGDILVINGKDAHNSSEKWYAEKVGVDADGLLEVYILEPDMQTPLILRFSATMNAVPLESVMEHASASLGTRKAWSSVGVKMLERGTTFVLKADEELLTGDYAEDISEESSSGEEDGESDGTDSLNSFIVSDDNEPLTY